jgi:hypothetical protein
MLALIVALAALSTVAIAALLVNIFERQQEADLYLRTVDLQRTK